MTCGNRKIIPALTGKPCIVKLVGQVLLFCSLLIASAANAELSHVEIRHREMLEADNSPVRYEAIYGLLHFTLDPHAPGNQQIADIALAPLNEQGLAEFSSDFKLLIPRQGQASSVLMYHVNNRGGSRLPPEVSPDHPLALQGHTFLATGWIAELAPGSDLLRLHAPVVTQNGQPVTGNVRYEIVTGSAVDSVNVAGAGHLAYQPTQTGLAQATLTRRALQQDNRQPVARDQFHISVQMPDGAKQPQLTLTLTDGFEPGVIYELIYEAQDPVLAGAGLAGIRDVVSAIRQQLTALSELDLPVITHTAAWGYSQSGRLLRQFLYQGFNEDLQGRRASLMA